MKMTVSKAWFKSSKTIEPVEANGYACAYSNESLVSINLSQPAAKLPSNGIYGGVQRYEARQRKLHIKLTPEAARQLADQLIRNADAVEARQSSFKLLTPAEAARQLDLV